MNTIGFFTVTGRQTLLEVGSQSLADLSRLFAHRWVGTTTRFPESWPEKVHQESGA